MASKQKLKDTMSRIYSSVNMVYEDDEEQVE